MQRPPTFHPNPVRKSLYSGTGRGVGELGGRAEKYAPARKEGYQPNGELC